MKKKQEIPEAVGSELLRAPHKFEFLAAMRLLEAMTPQRRSVAEGDDPRAEGVRFNTRPHLDFQPGDLNAIVTPRGAGDPFEVAANFFGLAQANGPLPYSFAEELIDRAFRHDHAGGAFLDLFHHRLISIFFRARKKYRPALTHRPPDLGRVGSTLKALAGLGTRGLENRLAIPDRSLAELSGLLLGTRRTQVGLEQAVKHHFGLEAEVLPFRGAFKKLEGHQATRLGTQNSVLRGPGDPGSDGAMLGDRVFIADAGFELRLGPVDDEGLERLLPGSRRYAALADLVHFYTDKRYDVALRPLVAAGAPRRTRLASHGGAPGAPSAPADESRPARLGWNSWLLTRPTDQADAQVVLRPGLSDAAFALASRARRLAPEEPPPQPFRLDLGSALDEA